MLAFDLVDNVVTVDLSTLLEMLASQLDHVECGFCGTYIYFDDRWRNGHAPVVRISDGKVELGYYCGKADRQVILFTIDLNTGSITKVYE